MKRRIVNALLAGAMVVSTLAGCGGGASAPADNSKPAEQGGAAATEAAQNEAAPSGKTQLNVATEICNSQQITWELNASWFVTRWGVSECLVKNGDDGSYLPWLATDWSLAEDNLTWTFNLRDDVKFSNGEPMTASKVKQSIENVYEKDENLDIQTFMEYTEITADDDNNSITIVTTKPVPDMPGVMAYPMMSVIDVDATFAEGRDPIIDGVIATGPYAFTSFTQDHDVQLHKNEFYYGEVPFETVNIQIVKESSNRLAALQDQSADMAINIASADRNILAASPDFEISLVAGGRTGLFWINQEGVLGNEALRKAVLMAYDDETVCNISTQGSYTAGASIVCPTLDFGGADIDDATPYDVEGAKKLLDDAGIVDGDGNGFRELDGKEINLQIKTQTNRQMDVMASALVENLKEIGIAAEAIPFTAQSDELNGGQFDMGSGNFMIIPTGDPANILGYLTTTNVNNYGHYSNPEYDALYEELVVTMDTAKRKELIGKLQKIANDDAAVFVGGYFNFNICGGPTVTGVHNPTCDYYWVTADIKPAN